MKWISVEDKLPPKDKTVLAYLGYGCETASDCHHYVSAFQVDNGHWYSFADIEEIFPTHWARLPKPPKI